MMTFSKTVMCEPAAMYLRNTEEGENQYRDAAKEKRLTTERSILGHELGCNFFELSILFSDQTYCISFDSSFPLLSECA